MTRRMLRYEVAVNDEPQDFLVGDPVHIAASPDGPHSVEFWAEWDDDVPPFGQRTFQVFGTGQPLPHQAVWRGTADRTPEGLVWHLYELLTATAREDTS